MLLIFRKCQLCIVLSILLMFCQVSGSCFYKCDYYKDLLSDCNWTQTHNHLVRKRALNHLAKRVRDMITTYR